MFSYEFELLFYMILHPINCSYSVILVTGDVNFIVFHFFCILHLWLIGFGLFCNQNSIRFLLLLGLMYYFVVVTVTLLFAISVLIWIY